MNAVTNALSLLAVALLCALLNGLFFATAEHHEGGRTKATDFSPRQQAKYGSYKVRTEHFNPDGSPKYSNQLVNEESPYLLQHAHNPVNWHPWGDAAFALAQAANKPVFLSIGYSTCHWCHVMEVESFDNEAIAAYLNEHFISIKVDREQRPDIDEIYMTAVQLFSGRGGWPMSSFLTPDGQPFFGGTYFPPEQFLQLLQKVAAAWREREAELRSDAAKVTAQIAHRSNQTAAAAQLDQSLIESTLASTVRRLDKKYGGFSDAPKFPNEPLLLLLCDQLRRRDNHATKSALELTLQRMAQGGIYDQVAGGFHRYSTDKVWLAPHFEKMLYNQALLARVYAETYQLTGDNFYRHISEEVIDYVLRDMRDPQGAFFSATDADSEDEEGVFFVWQAGEIAQLLSEEDAALVTDLYGVTAAGNFEGRNILFLEHSLWEYAWRNGLQPEQLRRKLKGIKKTLYDYRETREHPLRDEKIISAWNAMMINTLAHSAILLNRPDYLDAAVLAANKLWRLHVDRSDSQGRTAGGASIIALWRISLQDKPSTNATQEDYAYLAEAFITLFDSTADHQWLERAMQLTDTMISLYNDDKNGGFFASAAKEQGPLIARIKNAHDGAIPSGNSVAIRVLGQLFQRSGELRFQTAQTAALGNFSGQVHQYGAAYAYMLTAVANHLEGETLAKQHLGEGNIVAQLRLKPVTDKETQHIEFEFELTIKDGWHINSHKPHQEELIATQITLLPEDERVISHLAYPTPLDKTVAFQTQALSLFEDRITIQGTLDLAGATDSENIGLVRIRLALQACDDTHCLAPESRLFTAAPRRASKLEIEK